MSCLHCTHLHIRNERILSFPVQMTHRFGCCLCLCLCMLRPTQLLTCHQPCPLALPSKMHAYGLGYIPTFGQRAQPGPLSTPVALDVYSRFPWGGGFTGFWDCRPPERVTRAHSAPGFRRVLTYFSCSALNACCVYV